MSQLSELGKILGGPSSKQDLLSVGSVERPDATKMYADINTLGTPGSERNGQALFVELGKIKVDPTPPSGPQHSGKR